MTCRWTDVAGDPKDRNGLKQGGEAQQDLPRCIEQRCVNSRMYGGGSKRGRRRIPSVKRFEGVRLRWLVCLVGRRLFFGALNRALLDRVRRENKGGGGLVFFFLFPTPRQAVFLTLVGGLRRMAYGVGLLFRLYAEHGASGVSRSSSRRTGMATGTGLGRQVGASQRAGRGTGRGLVVEWKCFDGSNVRGTRERGFAVAVGV
ncbi:uncharacterized protein LY79DRAFT_24858 [Colletotrichum navitas]|uniref:Uncharacterized protein n=1 Tax=Colletotrichum navitas TaxID=681940 RepID=A0AAD8VBS0_9PEZI|nr:uncharacterized protein LY79DRAFT_24858 [Colletotrichum navitas]KAK1600589.1 hypothetical protein LY79DRAFT_24858 [Colletotrichum navitas]